MSVKVAGVAVLALFSIIYASIVVGGMGVHASSSSLSAPSNCIEGWLLGGKVFYHICPGLYPGASGGGSLLLPSNPPSLLLVEKTRLDVSKDVLDEKSPLVDYYKLVSLESYRVAQVGYGCMVGDARERAREWVSLVAGLLGNITGSGMAGGAGVEELVAGSISSIPKAVMEVEEKVAEILGLPSPREQAWLVGRAVALTATRLHRGSGDLESIVENGVSALGKIADRVEEVRLTLPGRNIVAGIHPLDVLPLEKVTEYYTYSGFYSFYGYRGWVDTRDWAVCIAGGACHEAGAPIASPMTPLAYDYNGDGVVDQVLLTGIYGWKNDIAITPSGQVVVVKGEAKCIPKVYREQHTRVEAPFTSGAGIVRIDPFPQPGEVYYALIARTCKAVLRSEDALGGTPFPAWEDNGRLILVAPKEIIVFDEEKGSILEEVPLNTSIPAKGFLRFNYWRNDLDLDGEPETIVMIAWGYGENATQVGKTGSIKDYWAGGYLGYLVIAGAGSAPKPLDTNGDLVVDAVAYPSGATRKTPHRLGASCLLVSSQLRRGASMLLDRVYTSSSSVYRHAISLLRSRPAYILPVSLVYYFLLAHPLSPTSPEELLYSDAWLSVVKLSFRKTTGSWVEWDTYIGEARAIARELLPAVQAYYMKGMDWKHAVLKTIEEKLPAYAEKYAKSGLEDSYFKEYVRAWKKILESLRKATSSQGASTSGGGTTTTAASPPPGVGEKSKSTPSPGAGEAASKPGEGVGEPLLVLVVLLALVGLGAVLAVRRTRS